MYFSARSDGAGRHFATLFGADGSARADFPLPFRGHGAAAHAVRGLLVMFPRRPGSKVLVSRADDPASRDIIDARPDRRFAGHGFFSPEGDRLYITEDNFEASRGVIGIYDVNRDFARLGEVSTAGIGPHQAILSGDGRIIAVCNGGIRTHPDFPRAKLNLATMRPSLALIDRESGKLLTTARLPAALHQLSIRHIDIASDGTMALGLQYEGPKADSVPLAFLYRGGALVPLSMTPDVRHALSQYVGSVAFDSEGKVVAVTSPVGSTVAFWNVADGRSLGMRSLGDACGLAAGAAPGRFVVTTGRGEVHAVGPGVGETLRVAARKSCFWDNHLLRVPA